MKNFTMGNTEGYEQSELDVMNQEFAELMAGYDENDQNYLDHEKNMSARVANNH